jgi:PhnB protein
MARVATYLNFMGRTEEAFTFYAGVFGTEFEGPVARMGDNPPDPSGPQFSDAEKNLVMHVALPILAGHMLMGTDMVESMGHVLVEGNNVSLNLEPDSREEADRLYNALADGGSDCSGMSDMFWGAYWGSLKDKFGIHWMVHYLAPQTDG